MHTRRCPTTRTLWVAAHPAPSTLARCCSSIHHNWEFTTFPPAVRIPHRLQPKSSLVGVEGWRFQFLSQDGQVYCNSRRTGVALKGTTRPLAIGTSHCLAQYGCTGCRVSSVFDHPSSWLTRPKQSLQIYVRDDADK